MKYYIIAGEASGDLHASNLIKSLKHKDAKSEFRCWGGDLMQEQGAVIVKHYKELAFMGFAEVLMNLRTILHNINFCKNDIKEYQPDLVILVDYPGFNLRIAEYVKSLNIKVFYYICPQVWAWKQSRIKILKKFVDKMFVILPFEKDFYAKHAMQVDFEGHPLLDAVDTKSDSTIGQNFRKENDLSEKPIIALLPGSRNQEISKMLGLMSLLPARFPDFQFVIAGTKHFSTDYYLQKMNDKNSRIVKNQTYNLLRNSVAAVVASGTATLETALFNVPQVVCYKGNPVSIFIGKILVKIKFISLVNLILDRKVVSELIQEDFNFENLSRELELILPGNKERKIMLDEYQILFGQLGGKGVSERIAEKMYVYLTDNNA